MYSLNSGNNSPRPPVYQVDCIIIAIYLGLSLSFARLKNKSTWTIDTDEEWNVHTWRPNGDFLERDENEEEYTYKELIELLDKGETMLIVINKD